MARPGVSIKVKQVSFGDDCLQTGMGIRRSTCGKHTIVDIPAGNGSGCWIQQHLRRAEAVGPRREWTEGSVAIATSLAKPFDLDMPVVTGAVTTAV